MKTIGIHGLQASRRLASFLVLTLSLAAASDSASARRHRRLHVIKDCGKNC